MAERSSTRSMEKSKYPLSFGFVGAAWGTLYRASGALDKASD